jgi:hypothetical protein
VPAVTERAEHLKLLREQASEAIRHAQRLVLMRNERGRKGRPFQGHKVGDRVWLEGTNLKLFHPTAKLAARRYGPFTITKVISPVVYQLTLPPQWKIFNTFHASLLSPYKETEEHGRNFPEPPPDMIEGEEQYEVEEITASRRYGRKKELQYRVRWKGYSEADDTWEPVGHLHAPDLVKEFHDRNPTAIRTMVLKEAGIKERGQWSAATASTLSTSPLPSPPKPSSASSMARRKANKCGTTTATPTPRKRSAPKLSASMRPSKRQATPRETRQTSPAAPTEVLVPHLPWPKWKRRPPGASRLYKGRPKALSEPPPDTTATTDLPYLAVHTVITPFGEITGCRTQQIARRELMARAGEWIPAQSRWRAELDVVRGGPRP